MSTVLVTGGNGFVAVQVIIAVIAKGYHVVATVRTEEKAKQTKDVLAPRLGAKLSNLSFSVVPNIEADDAFDEVIKSNQFVAVLHTATPFHVHAKDPKEMTGPAVGSTKSILRSVKQFGPTVKRVIITSSFAAIMDASQGMRPNYTYTEKDWNPISWEETHGGDPSQAYNGAKKWAEQAAWDFMKEEKPHFELVTLCPPFIFGQVAQYIESADQLNTSSSILYSVLTGKNKEITPQSVVLWVNVADVGTAHALAIDAPNAGNQRIFIVADQPFSNKQISDVFINRYPEYASKVPTKLPKGVEADGFPTGGYFKADNSLSKKLLGLSYQGFEDTLVQFAESVKALPAKSG